MEKFKYSLVHIYNCHWTSVFYILRLSNVLSVSTESVFKLSSGLSNIFFIAAAPDNYIYKVGSFPVKIWFQDKWLVPISKSKKFTLYYIITTKVTFFRILSLGLFVEKFENRKGLFKLDGCLSQSITLSLANILPKIF